MPKIGKFYPATLIELASWSTLSRNEIGPFLARFGIKPLGRKYPMLRVYEAMLGLRRLRKPRRTYSARAHPDNRGCRDGRAGSRCAAREAAHQE